jgi:hypothetical protein
MSHNHSPKLESNSQAARQRAKKFAVKLAVGATLMGANAQAAEATTPESHSSGTQTVKKSSTSHSTKTHKDLKLTKRSTYNFEDGKGYVKSALSFRPDTRKATLTGKAVSTETLPYVCPQPLSLGYENKFREPKAIFMQPGSFACIAAFRDADIKDTLHFKKTWKVSANQLSDICVEKRPVLMGTPPHGMGLKLSLAPVCEVINLDQDRSQRTRA